MLVPIWDLIGPIAELDVRNLPPEVHQWLRQRAQEQGRSMSAEAVTILRAALQGAQSGATPSQAIDRLRAIRRRAHIGASGRLAEELVREDRERSS